MKHLALFLGLLLLVTGCNQGANNTATESGGSESSSAETDSTPFVLDTALAKAKEENKVVLLEFTGSDWCPPCKQLEKNVLSTDDFKQYAAANLVFGKLDFPNRKPQSEEVKKNNAALSEQFNINAFPTLVLLAPDGKELWRQEGYGGENAKDFIARLDSEKK